MKHIIFTFALFIAILQISSGQSCQSFGWANYNGQTQVGSVTGGGTSAPVQVTTFAQLKAEASSSGAKVIHVMNDMGDPDETIKISSNKTIVGVKPNITVYASFQITSENVIVRNLICRGQGNSNGSQGLDAVNISGSARRIWFDHCTIMEGKDGNFDVVKGADNVTVTWCKFMYVTNGSHNLSNLIGSSDNESVSHGKLNVTYAYCWWENVNSRTPRTRYGKIHVLNCYYNECGQGPHSGFMSNVRVEGCFFENNVGTPIGMTSPGGQSGCFAIGCNRGSTRTDGYSSPFVPPYTYQVHPNSSVKAMVTDPDCGAGPTLDNPTDCGCGTQPDDCAGVPGGTAYWDDCQICVGGTTGKTPCVNTRDCNGTANGTADVDNCDRCVGGTTGKTACASVDEAETAACEFDGVTETKNAGYKGASYLNVDNAVGSKIVFYIHATTSGNHTLSFRYANGGTADRPAAIVRDGVTLPSQLSFPVTGNFTTYKTTDLTLNLNAGTHKLELVSVTFDGLANIDQIGYVSSGLGKGTCGVVTNVNSSEELSGIEVFPNPFTDLLKVKSEALINYQIKSVNGEILETGVVDGNSSIGQNLNPGFYILKLNDSVRSKNFKIVKTSF